MTHTQLPLFESNISPELQIEPFSFKTVQPIHFADHFRTQLELAIALHTKDVSTLQKPTSQLSFRDLEGGADFFRVVDDNAPMISPLVLEILYLSKSAINEYYSNDIVDRTSPSKLLLSRNDLAKNVHDLEQLKNNTLVPLIAFLEIVDEMLSCKKQVKTFLNYKGNVESLHMETLFETHLKKIRLFLKKAQDLQQKMWKEHSWEKRITQWAAFFHDVYHLSLELLHTFDHVFDAVKKETRFFFQVTLKSLEEASKRYAYLRPIDSHVSNTYREQKDRV